MQETYSLIDKYGCAYRMYEEMDDTFIESVETGHKYILLELYALQKYPKPCRHDTVCIFEWKHHETLEHDYYGEFVDFFAGADAYDGIEMLKAAVPYIREYEKKLSKDEWLNN